MQSEDLDFAFEEIRDESSGDFMNIFLENAPQNIQKPKDEPTTKAGYYSDDDINQWENYFTNKEPKLDYSVTKPSLIQLQKNYTDGLYKLENGREKRFIEVSDFKRKQYLRVVKGTKEQTSELNINLKTLTKSILREETLFMKMTKEEDNVILKFESSSANFKGFRQLFGVSEQSQQGEQKEARKDGKKKLIIKKKSDRIRKMCLRNFSSSHIVKQMHRGKMNQFNKLTLMKFLEPIRMSCVCPENFTNWKSKGNKK